MAHTTPTHTNRLIGETSPYLLQHAHNPVDWYPWGREALERARREDRLILLSIGYSACHWCHVMERESFEHEEIAALMNEHYVNIKVDREERPDLDDVYMAVTVAMNHGQGGWPMTVFLTPTLEPVFAGTYFPPADGHGRPGFPTLLKEIARAWREDRDQLRDRARHIAEQLRRQRRTEPGLAVGDDELRMALHQYADEFDSTHGGFGPAPKFPPATGLMLLLRLHRRFDDEHALTMVRTTLDGMARGGIYDQIGGGFARYATDDRWLVPHFEKMLYDNALLSRAYLDAYQVTGDVLYERIARETLDYILREMTSQEGGFYSSTDADSEGVEGAFFVWTPEEIVEVLGEADAVIFNAYYDVTPGGNWEGKNILHSPRPVEAVASGLDMAADAVRERLERLRVKVYSARARRVRPALDDKIITAWNGLMIGALAEGYRILRHPRYAEAARRAADFVTSTLRDDAGRPLRTYRAGTAHVPAFLDDYAYLSEGLVDLYEATGETAYLREAERLADGMIDAFGNDESGAFFTTPEDHEALLWRYREGTDGATPSANAAAAWVMARLAHHLGREDLRARAIDAIKAYGRMITRFPRAFAKSLIVVDWLLGEPIELAFVGARETPELEALCREAARYFIPHRIQAVYDPAVDEDAGIPLLRGKGLVDGKAALYVCRAFTCKTPVTKPSGVAPALEGAIPEGEPAALISTRRAGRATAAGTTGYAARFEHTGYRSVSDTGLITSLLGFGGYRTDDVSSEHREALTRALAAGINLVDTSTNYADGASERLVGSVLRELTEGGEIERSEVIVVSKLGYIQGRAYRLAQEQEERGAPFPEVVKIEDGLWHCIHPEFLADQLQRSLDRLELETLDICLLHNPEYALVAAARRGEDLEKARSAFYHRLTTAFRYLEDQVLGGRVGWYGVSSNTAAAPASDPDATSLTRMIAAAENAAGSNHHFRVLQLPLNLFEARAVLDQTDGRATVLDVAQANGVTILVNRPLNAFTGHGMVRLADVRVDGEPHDLESQFEQVRELERTFAERLGPELQKGLGAADPSRIFDWAEQLRRLQPQVLGLEQWAGVERQVNYAVAHLATELQHHLAGETLARWAAWRDQYLPALDRLIKELRRRVAEQALADATAVKGVIDPLFPQEHRRESLARKALWTVASTPGVTAVLTGMRIPRYVHDAVGIMSWSPLEDPLRVYRGVQALRR